MLDESVALKGTSHILPPSCYLQGFNQLNHPTNTEICLQASPSRAVVSNRSFYHCIVCDAQGQRLTKPLCGAYREAGQMSPVTARGAEAAWKKGPGATSSAHVLEGARAPPRAAWLRVLPAGACWGWYWRWCSSA